MARPLCQPPSEPAATPATTENTVRLAYRLLLGREVESPEALRAHLDLPTLAALRRAIMASPEFQSKVLHGRFCGHSKWVATEVMDRFTMWVDLADQYVSRGCLNNSWEPSESGYLSAHVACGDVVLDIGANVGWFSLLAAKCVGRKGAVHAFEPRPDTSAMLKRTIADNDLRSLVSVWTLALSNQWGRVELNWERDTDNPGHSFIGSLPAERRRECESTVVTAAVLDELLPELAPDFIKIDIEGAEARALAGAQAAIGRKHPPIMSELYPQQLQEVSGVSPRAYIAQLAALGYTCYLLEDGRPTRRLEDFPPDAPCELVSVVFERDGGIS